MMQEWWRFFLFEEANVFYVALGSVLITAASAIVGSFTLLLKRALVGDAVAHSILPGIALGFILTGTKNPIYIVGGAFLFGWISVLLIDLIAQRSKIKQDTALSLVLSVFFGFGILLLTHIQSSGLGAQSGLDQFLFGKAAAMTSADLWVFGGVALGITILTFLFFKEFQLISFNREYAQVQGIPVRYLEVLLTSLTVLAIVVGIQAVGVVLMAAMLVTPPAAARFWTYRLPVMILLAALFGAFSGFTGAFISYLAPAMPTGPWIVLMASIIAGLSFMFAPYRGVIYKLIRNRKVRKQINEENILKALYHRFEKSEHKVLIISMDDFLPLIYLKPGMARQTIHRLRRKGLLSVENKLISLSDEGLIYAKRVVRLHRLWELYLTEVLRKTPEQVHHEAEAIEHVISEEMEAKIEAKLNFPAKDPHQSFIPR
jgi:manganese/zinc/iron transport system permease protein